MWSCPSPARRLKRQRRVPTRQLEATGNTADAAESISWVMFFADFIVIGSDEALDAAARTGDSVTYCRPQVRWFAEVWWKVMLNNQRRLGMRGGHGSFERGVGKDIVYSSGIA